MDRNKMYPAILDAGSSDVDARVPRSFVEEEKEEKGGGGEEQSPNCSSRRVVFSFVWFVQLGFFSFPRSGGFFLVRFNPEPIVSAFGLKNFLAIPFPFHFFSSIEKKLLW